MNSIAPKEEWIWDDAEVLHRRGPRNEVSPDRAYAYLVERERAADGLIEDVATIFLTNWECPFRCLMCDLWKNTTEERVPVGSITAQIRHALAELPPATAIKLYNSGNFFDEQAIPRTDRIEMIDMLRPFGRVIVECHPKLVDQRAVEFSRSISGELEIAMGLETVDPNVLPRLNKRMSLADFERAVRYLLDHDIHVRAFILLRAPFQNEEEGIHWAQRSIDYAFSIGVGCCAVIPTRAGNGAMEELQRLGHFTPPSLDAIETVLDYGIGLDKGRVFMDLWDLHRFHQCPKCTEARRNRLAEINLSQTVTPRLRCDCSNNVQSTRVPKS